MTDNEPNKCIEFSRSNTLNQQLIELGQRTTSNCRFTGGENNLNKLKQYVNGRIAQYQISKPASYDDSFYASIKGPADIEKKIAHAEKFIASYESNSHPGYRDDVEDRALEVYQCFTALRKIGQAMSEIRVSPSAFDEIAKEQIDNWFNRFDTINQKAESLHTRFVLRPDLYR